MKKNDGGPAFPRVLPTGEFTPDECLLIIQEHAGMSLRDWFAGQALVIITSYPAARSTEALENADVARWAYQIADAMLKAREE